MEIKVLIIETNRALAEMWSTFLRAHSINVGVFIENDTPASDLTVWGEPDVVISGIEPVEGQVITGKELCAQLYGRSKSLNPPLIQLYASYLNSKQKQRMASSAFAIIAKPVNLSELLDRIRNAAFQSWLSYFQNNHASAMTADLKGDALVGILQYIAATGNSGIILVKTQNRNAYISFTNGAPLTAQCGDLSGTEAVYEVLTWEQGQASYFESEISEAATETIPEIKTLISERQRQKEEIRQAEQRFDHPGVYISRNDSIEVDPCLISGRIYAQLSNPKNISELEAELPDLTHRQLMITLNAMLMRDEIHYQNKAASNVACSNEQCDIIANFLKTSKAANIATHPITIGVYSAVPQLAKRFIGTICSQEIAAHTIIQSDSFTILLSEINGRQCKREDFFDLSAALVIFNKSAAEHIAPTAKFIHEAQYTEQIPFVIAEQPAESSTGDTASAAHLLGFKDTGNIVFQFDWQPQSCLKVVENLFRLMKETIN